ncbi:UPF0450 protein C17orf58 homolog [Pyxicephalus adspersus]
MDLLCAALTPGALLILSTALTCTATVTDDWQNTTWNLERKPSRSHSVDLMDIPWTITHHRAPNQGLLSAVHPLTPRDRKKAMMAPDKKTKSKLAVDNNTGLRKSSADNGNRLPSNVLPARSPGNEFTDAHKPLPNRNILDWAFTSTNLHTTKSISTQERGTGDVNELLDHDNNRPGNVNVQNLPERSYNSSKPAWITNRQPSSLLYHFHGFRKEFENKESCQMDCHKPGDEREAYCNSDFAVNGIVHDVEILGRGIQLLTVLVNSGGLYKINRLYITPDGFFFRVKVLAVDHLNCPKSCLDFKLGGRYIIMGRIFHKRMELPTSIQRTLSGRLRAGDGLVTSSSSFVWRYNRRKDRKVLAAAHSKCK